MKTAALLATTLALSSLWQAVTRDTNSRAATARGVKAYARGAYAAAETAFARSRALHPAPAASFNLGTSQVAAGRHEEGSATLSLALADPVLRADALYNRGNSALASNAFDYAIRDYAESLRLRPGDVQAKRNLEIALARKQAMQQQAKSGQKQNRPGAKQNQQNAQQNPASGARRDQQPRGDANAESLLRAVQQQEQEELQRMRRARAERGKVGW